MRVPDQMVKCVGFISKDENPARYRGTVFGVEYPYPSKTRRLAALHLVTAKHVADRLGTDFVIGFNGSDGRPIFTKARPEMKWYYHPTEPDTADVAIMPFASPEMHRYDFLGIPLESFATKERIEEFGIGLGDEIINIGLFTPFFGKTHFVPIVRSGNIAMMPRDRLPLTIGDVEAYLVEGRSIGGLSGSPVFCRNTVHMPIQAPNGRQGNISIPGHFHFLGLMHGHWDKTIFPDPNTPESVNMGVAIVIPATTIMEALEHPELIRLRKEAEHRTEALHYPTEDIAEQPSPFTQQDFEAALRTVARKPT